MLIFELDSVSVSQSELLPRPPHVCSFAACSGVSDGCKAKFRLSGAQHPGGHTLYVPADTEGMHGDTLLWAATSARPSFLPESETLVTTRHQEIILPLSFDPLAYPYCSIEKKGNAKYSDGCKF